LEKWNKGMLENEDWKMEDWKNEVVNVSKQILNDKYRILVDEN
jgi:hypothetical protein